MTNISKLISLIGLIITSQSYSQNDSISQLMDNTQGIKQEGAVYYNLEGYDVYVKEYQLNFDDKGFKKFKRKVKISKNAIVEDDINFPGIKVINSTTKHGEAIVQSKQFISKTENGKIKVVGFSTVCDRDIEIENEFYHSVMKNKVPQSVYTPMQIDSIEFANRYIKLGPACVWRDPRSVQCTYRGQINWSEFQSKKRAEQMIKAQMALNEDFSLGKILNDVELDVIFEGTPVKAIKRKLKIKLPKLIAGGSNILYIYYVVCEVRNTFVACVMSHYDIDAPEGQLPPLLREVMELY
jgi:hypothetical protein